MSARLVVDERDIDLLRFGLRDVELRFVVARRAEASHNIVGDPVTFFGHAEKVRVHFKIAAFVVEDGIDPHMMWVGCDMMMR